MALDLLRGYFLLVIFSDHIYRIPSFFDAFTGRGLLWVSAAEGFFLISGLLVGKLQFSAKKLLKRAVKLYFLAIGLTVLFTIWGQYLPLDKIKTGLWAGDSPGDFIFQVLTFKYIYGWADFLNYYAVFLFVSPLILFTLKKRKWWIVAVSSFLVWVFFRNVSQFFSWQILFFAGMIAGFYFDKAESLVKRFQGIINFITVITIITSARLVFGNLPDPFLFWFDKNTVGLGRLLLALIWFAAFYLFLRKHEEKINRLSSGVLQVLGKNSLLVYTLQSLIIFPLDSWIVYKHNYLLNSFFIAVLIFLLYLVTKKFSRDYSK